MPFQLFNLKIAFIVVRIFSFRYSIFPALPFNTQHLPRMGPGSGEDENKKHHPYFIDQMKLLVDDALAAKIPLAQQVYWSKSGKWMCLDDGVGVGVEPDFCMTGVQDTGKYTPIKSEGVIPPPSKYGVTVAMEMKTSFSGD